MKKVLAIFLSLIMLLGVLPISVFALNSGPSPYSAFLAFQTPTGKEIPDEPFEKIIYENGELGDEIENVSYDVETNTLTLSGIDTQMILFAGAMGSDFKINVVGENTVDCIRIMDFSDWGCGVSFIGDGVLTVNPNSEADHAIIVDCQDLRPKVFFGEDVTVNLYGFNGAAEVATVHEENGVEYDPIFVCENGQQLEVEKRHQTVFEGEVEGYIVNEMQGGYMYFGMLVSNPDDPDGIYTYWNSGYYDDELDEWVQNGYEVQKINKIIDGIYEFDYEGERPWFATEEELFDSYPPIMETVQAEWPETLNNRLTVATHSSIANIYKDGYNNSYVYAYSYNPETDENGYYVCDYAAIPELPGQYVVTPVDGIDISDLTYTDEEIGVYSLRNDGEPDQCGNLINIESPEGVAYTAKLIEDQSDPDNFHTDWHVFKNVYSPEWDLWFVDYSFNDGEGEIEINPQDFETSEWNAFTYGEIERVKELRSNYDANMFAGILCEDGEGNRYAADKFRYFDEDHFIDLYDFEYVDGTVIFTKNDDVDPSTVNVIDGQVELENEYIYEIRDKALTIGGEDNWKAYVNIVDNEGNIYTPDDVIEIKVGEKRFFWCETDFENNASHGITPFVGFSENDEHIWTLTPAGFKVTGGTGEELGYEGISSFGIEVDTTGMLVTTEAPLDCWLYEFNGLFPGMEGFDWNALTKTNTFTFNFAVAPNEGWNTFADGHKEYIKDGVKYKNKLAEIDGKTYYFDSDGKMVTSKLVTVDGKKYYFGKDGVMYTKRLISVSGKKYYMGADGAAYTKKLISVSGKKYYMGADGAAYTNKLISVSGKKYYMGSDGAAYMSKLASISGKKYYFGKDGVAYISKLASVDGKKYYFGKDGVAYTSKLASVSGKKYYFGKDGVAYKSKLISVSGKKYYIGKDCVAYKSKFASLSGKKYYFGSDCAMYKSKTFSVSGVKWKADSNGVCKKA